MNGFMEMLSDLAPDFEVEIHPTYSGRFMYGETCFGISGDFVNLFDLVLQVQSYAAEDRNNDIIPTPNRDSLGLGEIWYWPEWATSTEDDND